MGSTKEKCRVDAHVPCTYIQETVERHEAMIHNPSSDRLAMYMLGPPMVREATKVWGPAKSGWAVLEETGHTGYYQILPRLRHQ